MEEEKLIITEDMVNSFAEMFRGEDVNVKFAYDILNLRDKDNKESEENFNKITNIIIFDDKLFPTSNKKKWVLKMGDKRLILNKQKAVWDSESQARAALSRHLTDYMGQSGKSAPGLEWREREIIRWKTTPPGIVNNKNGYYSSVRPSEPEYQYDPNFDLKKFKREARDRKAKEMSEKVGYHARNNGNLEYFKAMKKFFSGGRELRDFLLKNNIIEIVEL